MALDWLPILPDGPKRLPVRRPTALALFGTISPIIQPAPPTELTWQPQFPVHPVRHRLRNFAPIAWTALPPLFQLGWLPVFRTEPFRRPPPHPSYVIMGDVGAQPAIARFPNLPMWTAPLRHRQRRLQEGVYPIAMSTLLNAAGCIELTAETFTTPLLTSEVAVSPSMTTETFTSPSMLEEDLC